MSDLPDGAWGRIAKRTFDQYRADGITNLAAALTYRSVLSLFPGLIALVALLGLLGQYPQTFDAVLKILDSFAPPTAVQTVSVPIRQIITHKGGAGALLGVGLAGPSGPPRATSARSRGRPTCSGKPSAGARGIGSGRSTWPSLWSRW